MNRQRNLFAFSRSTKLKRLCQRKLERAEPNNLEVFTLKIAPPKSTDKYVYSHTKPTEDRTKEPWSFTRFQRKYIGPEK